MLTLDEQAQMDFEVQERTWEAYEQGCKDLPGIAFLLHKPDERLSLEQHRARLLMSGGPPHFRIPGRGYINYRHSKRR